MLDTRDTVSEQTYDGKEVTDTAEEKLKKLEGTNTGYCYTRSSRTDRCTIRDRRS